MSFDWRQYLELAQYMKTNVEQFPDEEACYRTVASRAYYAVYRLTRNYVEDADGISFSGHQDLQDHLKKNPHHKARCRIGNQFKALHQIRQKADYESNLRELPVNTAAKALTQARRIESGLNALFK